MSSDGVVVLPLLRATEIIVVGLFHLLTRSVHTFLLATSLKVSLALVGQELMALGLGQRTLWP